MARVRYEWKRFVRDDGLHERERRGLTSFSEREGAVHLGAAACIQAVHRGNVERQGVAVLRASLRADEAEWAELREGLQRVITSSMLAGGTAAKAQGSAAGATGAVDVAGPHAVGKALDAAVAATAAMWRVSDPERDRKHGIDPHWVLKGFDSPPSPGHGLFCLPPPPASLSASGSPTEPLRRPTNLTACTGGGGGGQHEVGKAGAAGASCAVAGKPHRTLSAAARRRRVNKLACTAFAGGGPLLMCLKAAIAAQEQEDVAEAEAEAELLRLRTRTPASAVSLPAIPRLRSSRVCSSAPLTEPNPTSLVSSSSGLSLRGGDSSPQPQGWHTGGDVLQTAAASHMSRAPVDVHKKHLAYAAAATHLNFQEEGHGVGGSVQQPNGGFGGTAGGVSMPALRGHVAGGRSNGHAALGKVRVGASRSAAQSAPRSMMAAGGKEQGTGRRAPDMAPAPLPPAGPATRPISRLDLMRQKLAARVDSAVGLFEQVCRHRVAHFPTAAPLVTTVSPPECRTNALRWTNRATGGWDGSSLGSQLARRGEGHHHSPGGEQLARRGEGHHHSQWQEVSELYDSLRQKLAARVDSAVGLFEQVCRHRVAHFPTAAPLVTTVSPPECRTNALRWTNRATGGWDGSSLGSQLASCSPPGEWSRSGSRRRRRPCRAPM